MKQLHPVFHVDLLQPYYQSPESLGNRAYNQPPPETIEGQPEYEVEEICNHRDINNRREYLVHWKGYPLEDATWTPVSELGNCKKLFRAYKKSVGLHFLTWEGVTE
jgi:hypothetical protein